MWSACLPLLLLAGDWVTVQPAESAALFDNPHTGWGIVEYVDDPQLGRERVWPAGQAPWPDYAVVQLLFTWAGLEPSPGQLDWSPVDRLIDFWSGHGKQIVLIGSTESYGPRPGFGGCPEWLYQQGVPRWRDPEGNSFPDLRHPLYRQRLRLFLQAYADRYATRPEVELIALRGYGMYGEWHSGFPYPTVAARREALREVIAIWRAAVAGRVPLSLSTSYEWRFPTAAGEPLVLPAGTSIHDPQPPTWRQFLERSLFDEAFAHPDLIARRDGCGGAVQWEYDGRLLANLWEHWRRPIWCEPFGGRPAYTGPSPVGYPGTQAGDDYLGACLDEMLSYHPNWLTMHWGADFDQRYPHLVARGRQWMGYRLQVAVARWPRPVAAAGPLVVETLWENRALGRLPRAYPLHLALWQDQRLVWQSADPTFDATALVAGEPTWHRSTLALPATLPAGDYQLAMALTDAAGRPRIRLANEPQRQGWTLLGAVQVGPHTTVSPGPPVGAPQRTASGWRLAEPLQPGRVYSLRFRERVTRDPARDLDSDDPGYCAVYAQTAAGRQLGEVRWYSKAGQPARERWVLLPLGAQPAEVVWTAVGGGALNVAEVHLEDVTDRVQRLLAGPDWLAALRREVVLAPAATPFDRRRPPAPDPVIVATREAAELPRAGEEYPFLTTRPEAVPLAPNCTYTVFFRCALRPQIQRGDHAWCEVRGGGLPARRWLFTQRHTSGPLRRAYTFQTGPGSDTAVAWGLTNGGRAEVAEILLLRHAAEPASAGDGP
ncbi:MAG: DUF4832 domain-containing protein [Fimbriimonadaceae bacterium]|nr:DUF4832 domain-containing protein [Fimbriimonadaceae bacterium]